MNSTSTSFAPTFAGQGPAFERAHKTLQDRLVKELRLAGVNDIDAANAWLPTFVADYNRRFGRTPRSDKDLHRHLAPQDDLDSSFTWRVERTVSHALSLQYDRVRFLLEPSDLTRGPGGQAASRSTTTPMGGWRSATWAAPFPTALLTWSAASTRAPSSRTSASSRRWSFAAGCRPNCRLSSGASPHLADQRSGNTSSPSPRRARRPIPSVQGP